MTLPRSSKQYSWLPTFGRYSLSPEAIGLYILSGFTLYGVYTAASLPELKKSIKDTTKSSLRSTTPAMKNVVSSLLSTLISAFQKQPQLMVPGLTSIFIASITAFYERYSLNSAEDIQEHSHFIEKTNETMLLNLNQASEAMKSRDFFKAEKLFCEAAKLAKQLCDLRKIDIDIYITCVVKQGRALFYLKKYVEAHTLLAVLLPETTDSSLLQTTVLNLIGLISYKQGLLPIFNHQEKDVNPWFVKAKQYFIQSYNVNQSQNSVYFYIKYLESDYKFITDNIPEQAFKPIVYLPVRSEEVLQTDLPLLFADALFRQQKYKSSVDFYEKWLAQAEESPSAFIELSILKINGFNAYAHLLLTSKPLTSADHERACVLLTQAHYYLENELFVSNNLLELAQLEMNHGYVYCALAKSVRVACPEII